MPVTLRVVNGTGTVNGLALTPTAGNSIEIEVLQAGDDSFEAATPVRITLLVKPTLSIGNLSVNKLCVGASFSVDYQVQGLFDGSNQMNVYLSDVKGNFTGSQQGIATVAGASSGTISVTLPTNLASSRLYQLRETNSYGHCRPCIQ